MLEILTDDVPRLRDFFRNVLGMTIKEDLGQYVEFNHEGVRLALGERKVMKEATGSMSFEETPKGHSFGLAFCVFSPEEVNNKFKELIEKGATPVKKPTDMPWGQRTAFFADPDGNIHEVFADLPK